MSIVAILSRGRVVDVKWITALFVALVVIILFVLVSIPLLIVSVVVGEYTIEITVAIVGVKILLGVFGLVCANIIIHYKKLLSNIAIWEMDATEVKARISLVGVARFGIQQKQGRG